MKIFGARSLPISIKLTLGWLLVCSRLLYNMHIWSVFSTTSWRIINNIYMKLWRRIANDPRFGRTCKSDLEVRQQLSIPSLDCVVRSKRLKYLARVASCEMWPLRAALNLKGNLGERMPWVSLILDDFRCIFEALPKTLGNLTPPWLDPEPTWQLITQYPKEWCRIVDLFFTFYDDPIRWNTEERATLADSGNPSWGSRAASVSFACSDCGHTFGSEKALNQHKRKKHHQLRSTDKYVPDWTQCPVCFTQFDSRESLIVHLSEYRVRSKHREFSCAEVFAHSDPHVVPQPILDELACKAKVHLKRNIKDGHTRHIVHMPARRGVQRQVASTSNARSHSC